MNNIVLKSRLTVMNFLEFAVWGAYLTSMGTFLAKNGYGDIIGWFYAVQGIVSLVMPGVMGIVADRWVQAQRLLSLCHVLAGGFLLAAGWYGLQAGFQVGVLFALYALSVAFYMPTLALSNSVAFNGLTRYGLDIVKDFPPIRVFGTVGFIVMMMTVDLLGYQDSSRQFLVSGALSLILAAYSLMLPACPVKGKQSAGGGWMQALGLDAFKRFREWRMAVFFIFSMLLGVSLQITNGYANPYITSFSSLPEFADTFGAQHANILISISQISETCCILLIPFFLKRFGIKRVMMIAMLAWVLRFGLFGMGDTGAGVWMFVLSCIVYGVAFDFFNISGALFVDRHTSTDIRSSAQGLFMIMTNGLGATIGTLSAGAIVDHFCQWQDVAVNGETGLYLIGDWSSAWYIFAGFALVVAVLFALLFREKK